MPISRKKACSRCRDSKLRCNLATPACSRCVQKRIGCVYDGSAFAYASPYARPTGDALSVEVDSGDLMSSVLTSTMELGSESEDVEHLLGLGRGTEDLDPSEATVELAKSPAFSPAMRYPSSSHNLLFAFEKDTVVPSGATPLPFLDCGKSPLDVWLSHNLERLPVTETDASETRLMQVQRSQVRRSFRRRIIVRDCILSNVVLGQLMSYPKMLIEGDMLPPFIHAPCHMDEELALDCRHRGRHQCLHTTLAICSSIVDMFYARTTVNSDFVWRTIYTELKRLRKKFPTVDTEGKLVIVQSLTIFVILQAIDTQSAEKNDVAHLLNTALELLIALVSVPEYKKEPYTSRPRRKDFVLRESINRLISVYGVIDLLLEGLQDPAARACEPGKSLNESVLPCHRDIWEARTTTAWLHHFDDFLSKRIKSTVLLVKHLVDSPDAGCPKSSQYHETGQGLLPDVVLWSEKLDALGTLVYMVIPLHQHRLGNAAWETIQQ